MEESLVKFDLVSCMDVLTIARRHFTRLFLFLALALTAWAQPALEIHREGQRAELRVRPDNGEAWRLDLGETFAEPYLVKAKSFFAVRTEPWVGKLEIYEWSGRKLGSLKQETQLGGPLWAKGSRLYGLEGRVYGSSFSIVPSRGSELWYFETRDESFHQVAQEDAPAELRGAPTEIVLEWYGRHGLTPPPDLSSEGLSEVWRMGLWACRGDLEARHVLTQRLLPLGESTNEVALALALSGPEVLTPVLLEKARRAEGPEANLHTDWSLAMQSLRHSWKQLPFEQFSGAALEALPSGCVLDNRDRLLGMARKGNRGAAKAVARAVGPWSPEVPAQLLAMPEFPAEVLVSRLDLGEPVYPGTVPLLMERLHAGQDVYRALSRQSQTYLPPDKALWEAWWACRSGQEPPATTPPYAFVMHALASGGRLTPAELARHPRLLAKVKLPIPCQISGDGRQLLPFGPLRPVFPQLAFGWKGQPEKPRTPPSKLSWGVHRDVSPFLGEAVIFSQSDQEVALPLSSFESLLGGVEKSLADWYSSGAEVYLSHGRRSGVRHAQDLDPTTGRACCARAEGLHIYASSGEMESLVPTSDWGRFLSDGSLLISGVDPAKIWRDGAFRSLPLGQGERLSAVSGERMALTSEGQLRVVEWPRWREVRKWSGVPEVNCSFSLDGGVVVAGGQTISLYDIVSGATTLLPDLVGEPSETYLSLDSSGRYAAISDSFGNLCLWDLKPSPPARLEDPVKTVEEWTGTRWSEGMVEPIALTASGRRE